MSHVEAYVVLAEDGTREATTAEVASWRSTGTGLVVYEGTYSDPAAIRASERRAGRLRARLRRHPTDRERIGREDG